jgi:hypothetical protein
MGNLKIRKELSQRRVKSNLKHIRDRYKKSSPKEDPVSI